MTWANDWIHGVPMVVGLIAIHAIALAWGSSRLVGLMTRGGRRTTVRFAFGITIAALGATVLHGLQAAAWALLYVRLGALDDQREALLYSLNAITAYGHAAITLADPWRLLGAIEAVNGLILFGMTTAFLFAVAHQLWPDGFDGE